MALPHIPPFIDKPIGWAASGAAALYRRYKRPDLRIVIFFRDDVMGYEGNQLRIEVVNRDRELVSVNFVYLDFPNGYLSTGNIPCKWFYHEVTRATVDGHKSEHTERICFSARE